MSNYRILTLDGGGLRGIYTARLLDRISQQVPTFIAKTHLFAGTSTGGILGLGLAYGYTPAQGVEFYRECGTAVFADSFLDDIVDLWNVVGAQYSTTNLKKVLTKHFGDDTLNTILTKHGKHVLIPSFDLDAVKDGERRWKPKFFHNFAGPDSDGTELIVDVALCTSAAPSYFPSYEGYIDGGVVCNNPSTAALAQALDPGTGGQALADVRILSFGTGYYPQYIRGKRHDWGLAQWARPLIDIMLEGTMGVSHFQCRQILGKSHYHRLAPALPQPVALDDADALPSLIEYADAVDITPTVDWIGTNYL